MYRLTYKKRPSRWNIGQNPTPYTSRKTFQEVCDRLGRIEDILGDDYDLERLWELVSADRNGLCIVIQKDRMIYHFEETESARWVGNKPIQDIIFLCGWGLVSLKWSIAELGKTFFLSRKDAEAALKER